MALRLAVLAALPAALLGAKAAPGCGCEVSHCCRAFNASESLERVFANTHSDSPMGVLVTRDRGGYTPACGLLGLIPGAFDSRGACSASLAAMGNATVCEAIEASAEASGRLQSGPPVLSVFVEPGRCEELQPEGACWTSRDGQAAYSWFSDNTSGWWCRGSVPVASPALAWSVTCPVEGGLTFRAQWVDNEASTSTTTQFFPWWLLTWTTTTTAGTANSGDMNGSDMMNGSDVTNDSDASGGRVLGVDDVTQLGGRFAGPGCDPCEDPFTGGLEATVAADDWVAGAAGSPRWVCLDLPRGDPDLADARVLAYSVGDLTCPAFAFPTTTWPGNNVPDGSPRSSVAALASVAALVAAVAAAQ